MSRKHLGRLGLVGSVVLPIAAAMACSGADSPPSEQVGQTSEAIGVSIANGCAVFWEKINYDTPGNQDVGEFIELRVEKTAGSTATTLGQCGLSALYLLSGGNCVPPYATINLANVTIPANGLVQICDTNWNSACDVDPGGSGWLQNDNEALLFVGPGFTPLLHASWEGAQGSKVCYPDAGALPTVTVQSENNNTPDYVSVWCSGGFQLRLASEAGLGMAYTCAADAGTDAPPDAVSDATVDAAVDVAVDVAIDVPADVPVDVPVDVGSDAAGGTGGTATDAATDAAGGTAGSATGGAAGSGGTAGAAGGTAGTAGGTAGAGGGTAGAGGGTAGAGGGTTGGTGGTGATDGGTTGGTGGKTDAGTDGGTTEGDDSGDDGGCGCKVPGGSTPSGGGLLALLGAAFLFTRRRR